MAEQGHHPSYIFRDAKGSMYEGGHRVPTIVRYPKEVAPGSTCDANICHTDFFATFAEFFGAAIPEEFAEDSFSNLSLWRGTGDTDRKATVCNAFMGYIGLIKGDYKLCCKDGGTSQEWRKNAYEGNSFPIEYELYNLAEDISETIDFPFDSKNQSFHHQFKRCGRADSAFKPPHPIATPAGVDFEVAQRLGLRVIWALSLPGKVAPLTAGAILKEVICNLFYELGV